MRVHTKASTFWRGERHVHHHHDQVDLAGQAGGQEEARALVAHQLLQLWPKLKVGRVRDLDESGAFSLDVALGSACKWTVTRQLRDVGTLYSALALSDRSTTTRLLCPLQCLRSLLGNAPTHLPSSALLLDQLDEFLHAFVRAINWTQYKPLRHFLGITTSPLYRNVHLSISKLKASWRAKRCRGYMLKGRVQENTRRASVARFAAITEDTHPNLWKVSQAAGLILADPYATVISIHSLLANMSKEMTSHEAIAIERLILHARPSSEWVNICRGRLGTLSLNRDREFRFRHDRLIHEREGRMMVGDDNDKLTSQLTPVSLFISQTETHARHRHRHHSHHHSRHHHHHHDHHDHHDHHQLDKQKSHHHSHIHRRHYLRHREELSSDKPPAELEQLESGKQTVAESGGDSFIDEVGNVLLDSTVVSLIYLEVLKQL